MNVRTATPESDIDSSAAPPRGMSLAMRTLRANDEPPASTSSPSPSPETPVRQSLLQRGLSTDQALWGLALIALFACGSLLEMQDDSWWHLRCGQLIWSTMSVPIVDPFSYALPPDTHWPNHEWLAQVIWYGLYQIGGLPLILLSGGVVIAAAGLFLLRTMRGGVQLRLVLLMLILPWLYAALSLRPQIFTMLALAATLWVLQNGRFRWLPLIFLLWANLHGGVSLGGLILVAASVCAIALRQRCAWTLCLMTALAGAATLLTPMGVELLTFPITSVGRLKQLDITEWNAPGFDSWQHLYFWALLAGYAVCAVRGFRRLPTWPDRMFVVVSVLFAVLATISARNIPLFLMIAAVVTSRSLSGSRTPQPATDYSRQNLLVVGAFALIAAVGLTWAYATPWDRLRWQPVSPEAYKAIAACPEPTFNTYNAGGYVIWFMPQRKVFIDSRQDPYPVELLAETIRTQQTGDYAALFDKYNFRSAIMEPHWPLGQRLREDGWRVTYTDDTWLVLVRDDFTSAATR